MSWAIQAGNNLDLMPSLPEGSIDAIVTSPPYADQRDYALAAAGERVPYGETRTASRKQRREAPAKYVERIQPFLEESLRVCSPTGSMMLNLGVIMRDGEEHWYADEILRNARALGWKLLHRMVWFKPNSIPLSHSKYLHIKHEWVFWLAPTTDAYRGYDTHTRSPHSETSLRRINQGYYTRKDQRYIRRGYAQQLHPEGARPATVFDAAVGRESVKHTCPWPLKLALQLVSLSCPPGGLVLDPYCGSGTTGLACQKRDRHFIGMDLYPEFCDKARARLGDPEAIQKLEEEERTELLEGEGDVQLGLMDVLA